MGQSRPEHVGWQGGEAADQESFAAGGGLPLLGCWFKPSSGLPCLEGFAFNSFTCHVPVNLLTSITA